MIVKFGQGESKKVGLIVKEIGWKKAFIVTDKGVVNAGLIKGITDSLENSNIEYIIFDEVKPNPTSDIVEKAKEQVKKEKCDFIIGLGGGSSIDAAKATALLVTNPGTCKDYAVWPNQPPPPPIKNHPLPLIAIPTTAGTGSEMDYFAGITDSETSIKMDLEQRPMRPGGPYSGASIVIIDPALTITLPPKQTAATGMDALLHAIGAYVSRYSIPHASALALYSIKLISKNLPIAYADGSNIEAREKVMLAANLSGICENFVPVIGADHALGLATADFYHDIIHGEVCSIFAPPVMEFNRIAVPSKYAKIAALMGENVKGMSIRDAAIKSVEAVKKLIYDLDLPTNLKSIGIRKEDIQKIAKSATQKIDIEGNPRKIEYKNLLKIVEKVYE
jgi:alcohol dehydrogenase class IV